MQPRREPEQVAAPDITVLVLTYNQRDFVEQTLASVLDQQTDRSIEVLVADDASTDGTAEVLVRSAAQDDRVRLLQRKTNLGVGRNFADAWSRCRGRYIAYVEGDDWWIDPHKLERQWQAMEANSHWVTCFTQVEVFQQDAAAAPYIPPVPKRESFTFEDLLESNVAPTCTLMFRRSVLPLLPGWMESSWIVDYPLHLLHLDRGVAGYLPVVTARYRVHGGGVWSGSRYARQEAALGNALQHLARALPDPARRSAVARRSHSCYIRSANSRAGAAEYRDAARDVKAAFRLAREGGVLVRPRLARQLVSVAVNGVRGLGRHRANGEFV